MAEPLNNGRTVDIGSAALQYREAAGRWPTRLELWNYVRGGEDHGGFPGLNADVTSPGGTVYTDPTQFLADIETSAGSFNFEEVEQADFDDDAVLNETEADFGNRFGHLVPLLDIPEIREVARRAIDEDLSPQEVQNQIAQTDWAQSRSAREREAEVMQRSDPGTWNQEMRNQTERITRFTSQLAGRVVFDDAKVNELAQQAWVNQWSDDQLRRSITTQLDFSAIQQDQPGGQIAVTADAVRQLADDYGVPVSNQRALDLTRRISLGEMGEEGVRLEFANVAKRTYGAFADQIDAQTSLRDALDPYIETASRELGIPSEQITLNDPKWRAITSHRDAQGNPAVMDLNDWTTRIRTDQQYGWADTINGQNTLAEKRNALRRGLGF